MRRRTWLTLLATLALSGCTHTAASTIPTTPAAAVTAACNSYVTAMANAVDTIDELYKSGGAPTMGTHVAIRTAKTGVDLAAAKAAAKTGDAMRSSSAELAVIDDRLRTWSDSPVDIRPEIEVLKASSKTVFDLCGLKTR